MNYYTSDSLRLVAREHLEQRRREAENERLARKIRGTGEHRWRSRLIAWLALGPNRRVGQPRLER